jgi:hypothetical protein
MKVDANMVSQCNVTGYTPLHLFVSTHQCELQYFYHYSDKISQQRDASESHFREIWGIVETFVGVEEGIGYSSMVLHKCLSVSNCPVLLVILASRLYPSQLLEGDLDGNTPLHLAVQKKEAFLVKYLLNAEPRAAQRVNNWGQTPFCVARTGPYAQQWLDEIHPSLLNAHPLALHKAQLSPFLLAKVLMRILRAKPRMLLFSGNMVDRNMSYRFCSVTTVFEIIRFSDWISSSQ